MAEPSTFPTKIFGRTLQQYKITTKLESVEPRGRKYVHIFHQTGEPELNIAKLK
jgi:hypothetical protein